MEKSLGEIEEWIVGRFADELHLSTQAIARDRSILTLGIDSVQILSVMTQIEDWAGIRFSENPLEDYETIAELSQHVADLIRESRSRKCPVK